MVKPNKDEKPVPQKLVTAKNFLEKMLLVQPKIEALSAETGTGSYGFENIVGVGVGEKMNNGKFTDQMSVIVYVVVKASEEKIDPKACVPKKVKGVVTDVVEVGEVTALAYRGRYRPALGGVSIGHFRITAGTLGCLVQKNNKVYILSNNHVIANSNVAAIEDPILQPGPADGGRVGRDEIGRLSEFIRIKTDGSANFVDAAIARSTPPIVRPNNIAFGKISNVPASCGLNMIVKKAGRTTQITKGYISDCNATFRVSYGSQGIALFRNQIVVRGLNGRAFSMGGDSGSLILTDRTNQPVALLFAGGTGITIANPIGVVLSALRVSIYN